MSKKHYTLEFKQEAVKLITEQGYTHSDVSKRLGIPHANLSRWVREYRPDGSNTVSVRPSTSCSK